VSSREGDLDGLTYHGGRIDVAARRFPNVQLPWIDLSTGINPVPWSGETDIPVDWSGLPSGPALRDLEAAAAHQFGAASDRVAALPGTEIGLCMLAALGLPAPYAYVTPGYGTHAAALPGATAIPAEALAEACGRGGTVLLANPNNPDGRALSPATLVAELRHRDGWMILDEAFADVDPMLSIIPHLREDDPVLVFRSFGKFFGLAGLRLGFVCGPDAMLRRVRAGLGSWPVSSAAITIGTAAYCDTDWIYATRRTLAGAADRLDVLLTAHGLTPIGACSLFRMVETRDADALFGRLGQAAILVRPFDDAPHRLRFGLPSGEEAWARLDRALGDR
jgi:cobalamin biosynthetic protein CobC